MSQDIPSVVALPLPTDDEAAGSSTGPAGTGPAPQAPRRGRPRDPLLDERALRATLDVFGAKGWAGLTYDEVATRARVGKSSLYLRWPTKERLLADALRRTQQDGAAAPADSEDPADVHLRTYLVEHAMRRAELYVGEHGLAMLRLYVESRALPEVFAEIREEAITSFVLAQRHRVEDAIAEGDLCPGASAVQLLDAIEGAVLMHVLVTPPQLTARMRRTLPEYVETLVDAQLRAAGGPGTGTPGPPRTG